MLLRLMHSLVSKEVVLCELEDVVRSVHEQCLQEVSQECPQFRVPPDVGLVLLLNISLPEHSTH